MKSPTFQILFMAALSSSLMADPLPQPQPTLTQGSADTWNGDWQGVISRSYFPQTSVDLSSWQYAPIIKFGDGLHSIGMFTNNEPKFFFRLKYTDDPTTDPELEDFDLDGIGSLMELKMGLDPFVSDGFTDLDGDGINDLVEQFWFHNLTTMNATSDQDGDGIPDILEVRAGANPTLDQSADASKRTDYQYDAMGRLTGAGDVSYTFDIEGNLKSSNSSSSPYAFQSFKMRPVCRFRLQGFASSPRSGTGAISSLMGEYRHRRWPAAPSDWTRQSRSGGFAE